MGKPINSLGDILKIKADEIDSSGIKDDISLIQQELDRNFYGEAKIDRLQDDGTLFIHTSNSSIASEIRLKQYSIIQSLSKSIKNKLTKFRIVIR